MKRLVCLCLISLFFATPAPHARADIFQWEYINPANPGLGKQPSTTLCVDGAGVNAVPHADFYFRNLTMAYLIGADLRNTDAYSANLTDADLSQANFSGSSASGVSFANANLSQANLMNTNFNSATLTGANLSGAEVRGTGLSGTAITTANFIPPPAIKRTI